MKWFKHQSTARNDERLARLEDKAGLEGYGFYFKMLEIVAEIIDETDRYEVTYSLSRWGRQANITSKKFIFLAQCCADVGLMIVQRCDDDYTVKIPNLLKYRDNHTKNLQVTYKQEVEVEVEVEIDKEVDKETEKKVTNVKTLRPVVAELFPQIQNRILVEDWLKVRKAKKAPVTETAIAGFLHEVEKSGLSLEDALKKCCEQSWAGFKASWLHKQETKKLDEITPELFDWAVEQGIQEGKVKPLTDEFILNHRSKGHEFVDWEAAWKLWMIKSVGYAEQRR